MAARLFEETVLPHLDAAFNYARWLTRNDAEAEDVVQDACVRAMRYLLVAARRRCARVAVRDRPEHVVQPGRAAAGAAEAARSTTRT